MSQKQEKETHRTVQEQPGERYGLDSVVQETPGNNGPEDVSHLQVHGDQEPIMYPTHTQSQTADEAQSPLSSNLEEAEGQEGDTDSVILIHEQSKHEKLTK